MDDGDEDGGTHGGDVDCALPCWDCYRCWKSVVTTFADHHSSEPGETDEVFLDWSIVRRCLNFRVLLRIQS